MGTSRNPRKEAEKREEDLDFLTRLRGATRAELEELAKNHAHKKAPLWKKVAIIRALARLGA